MFYAAFQFIVALLVIMVAQLIVFPVGALLYIFSAVAAALLDANTLTIWLLLNSVIAWLFILSYAPHDYHTAQKKGFLSL